jgi:hypothetical protein
MIGIADRRPAVRIDRAEYVRLLGYPRGWRLEDRALELADWAETWYGTHGRPWVHACEIAAAAAGDAHVRLESDTFSCARLHRMFREASVGRAVAVAVTAGPELEAEAQRRWHDQRPDEYFFLEVYGSAVVEHLVTAVGAELCAASESRGLAVLPHYSPGYPEWDVAEQARLLSVIAAGSGAGTFPVGVLESGMLRPKKSLLAVFGLTPEVERVRRLTDLVPCAGCSYAPCEYRRVPYRQAVDLDPELPVRTAGASAPDDVGEAGGIVGTSRQAARHAPAPALPYSVPVKALRRWARERLTIEPRADGSTAARFRYEGTTCTNSGRPLHFEYHVTLGPKVSGYPILEQQCGPSSADTGHPHMCQYLADAAGLMASIASERPLHGRRLEDVLTWQRPAASAGCYCDADSRAHKWGLVFETLHFALSQPPPAETPGVRDP